MVDIRALTTFDLQDIQRITGPYTCHETYRVTYYDAPEAAGFTLERVPLDTPFTARYDHFDDDEIARYQSILPAGFSFGAYDGDLLVGLLVAEKQDWNDSLTVWEFHVAAAYRRQSLGRRLMDAAVEQARAAGLRIITCETQNRNAVAIQVYRALGFRPEGIDISYYSNTDYPDRGIAVFMKRRL